MINGGCKAEKIKEGKTNYSHLSSSWGATSGDITERDRDGYGEGGGVIAAETLTTLAVVMLLYLSVLDSSALLKLNVF